MRARRKLSRTDRERRRSRRARTGLASGLALAVLFGAAAVVAPRPRLPRPTGPYAIGTTVRTWTDDSRPEPFTADPDDHRSVVAQIWYPAAPGPESDPDPYLDSATAAELAELLGVPPFALGLVPGAATHAHADAPPAGGRFPVLVHLSGHSGFRGESQAWFEELVSHGYVVISLDQPGSAAHTVLPDGRELAAVPKEEILPFMPEQLDEDTVPIMNGVELPGGLIPFLAQDASLTLDRAVALDDRDQLLAGRLDTDRAGVFGLSLGGYTAPEACRQDQRFRACLVADAGQTAPVAAEGIDQPLMIMTRDASSMRREREQAGGWPETEIRATLESQRSLFEHSEGPAWFLTINDMHHLNWTDLPLWSPLFRWTGLAGPMAPDRGQALIGTFSRAFFDRTLKDRPAGVLAPPEDTAPGNSHGTVPDACPEVTLERR